MSQAREELAGIVRSLRRGLERERAAGGGELLATGVARARRAGAADAREAAPGPPGAPAAGTSGAMRAAEPAGPAAASAAGRARSPMSAEERADIEAALASGPAPAALPSEDLFGQVVTPAARARAGHAAMPHAPLPPFAAPLAPRDPEARRAIAAQAAPLLEQIAVEARACTRCGLSGQRTQAVPGVGSALSGLVFVGEGPGADEDRLGEPFVGRAGQLLDRIIEAMNRERLLPGTTLDRTTVYIANILKCRPPENRVPLPNEVEACTPFLVRQLAALQPRVIVCLGKTAAEFLVGARGSLGGMRGRVHRYQGAKLIVTYHPAACLRNPGYKRPVWEDMQLLAREYLAD
jgi:DNA polymerase